MTRLILIICLVGLASPVLAQTGAVKEVEVRVYAPGVDPLTGTPVATSKTLLSAAVCNRTSTLPATAQVVVAPKSVEVVDPVNAGKVCVVDQTAVFAAITAAVGQFRVATTLIDDTGRRGVPEVALDSFLSLGPVPLGRPRVSGGGS